MRAKIIHKQDDGLFLGEHKLAKDVKVGQIAAAAAGCPVVKYIPPPDRAGAIPVDSILGKVTSAFVDSDEVWISFGDGELETSAVFELIGRIDGKGVITSVEEFLYFGFGLERELCDETT